MKLDDAVFRGRQRSIEAASSTFRTTGSVLTVLMWIVLVYGAVKVWNLVGQDAQGFELASQIADTIVLLVATFFLARLARRAADGLEAVMALVQDIVKQV